MGLESDQVREFKQLQDENTKLKRLVADVLLDKVILQDVWCRSRNAGSISVKRRPAPLKIIPMQ